MSSQTSSSFSVLTKQRISQHLDRAWMRHLSPSEYKVARLVFDRTFAWGNWSEEIAVQELRNGRGAYGDGTGLSQRSIFRCLDELKGRGALVAAPTPGRRTLLGLNIYWAGDERCPVRPVEFAID